MGYNLNIVERIQLRIARLLINNPRIIIDDVMDNFSQNAMDNVWRILEKYMRKGGSIICFSHNYSNVFGKANRILILKDATIVLELDNEHITKKLLKDILYENDYETQYSHSIDRSYEQRNYDGCILKFHKVNTNTLSI